MKRRHLDQARQIASRPHRNGDVRNIGAENFYKFLFHAQAVHVLHFVPAFERNHQIDSLFVPDAFYAEHGGDIDDADAAHFHVIASELRARADDLAAIHQRDAGDVVGDEAVTAIDQGEDRFTFADAAFATDDDAHAEDIDHAADLGAARSEQHFQRQGGEVDELHRDQWRLENRHAGVFGRAHETAVGPQAARENHRGNF